MNTNTRAGTVAAIIATALGTVLVLSPSDVAPPQERRSQAARAEIAGDAPSSGLERQRIRPTPYHAFPGTRLGFDYSLAIEASSTGAGAERGNAERSGTLQLDVLTADDAGLVAAIEFAGSIGEGESKAGQRPARLPTAFVDFASDGGIKGYRFAAGTTARSRNHVRSLLAPFVFLVPTGRGEQWQASGCDPFGAYVASYAVEPGAAGGLAVVRRKERYAAAPGPHAELPQIAQAEARARLDDAIGWLVHAEVRETVNVSAAGGPATVTRLTGRMGLRDRCVVTPSELPRDLLRFAPEMETQQAGADDLRQRLEGVTFADLLAALRQSGAGEPATREMFRAWQSLGDLIRIDPALAARILEMILQGEARDGLADMLLTALGSAGHAPAQDALLSVYGDATLAEHLRETAALSMFQLQEPELRLVAALGERVQATAQLDAVAAVSMLSLGTLAGRTDTALGDGRTPVQMLLGLESAAATMGGTHTWLEALGNAASPQALPKVVPYLTHTDDHVRESATSALRGLRDPSVVPALVERARHDSSARVRAAAVTTLAQQPQEAAVAVIRDIAQRDPSEPVRQRAITALAERRDAASLAVLHHVAEHDRCASLQKLARDLVRGG